MPTAPPPLPPRIGPERPYTIALVCLGNICRSPMASVVLAARLTEAGLADRVRLSSGGTGDWHVGERMDDRAATVLRDAGYDPDAHRGRQVDASWFPEHDLVLAMDRRNLADLTALAPEAAEQGRLLMFRRFDPESPSPDADVPDPWFGELDGYHDVLAVVERTAPVLTAALGRELSAPG